MSEHSKQDQLKYIIVNPRTNKRYKRGHFLGKGGFARCYEFKDTTDPDIIFAGKVISKTLLVKPHHKEKTFQEIKIHSSLSHKYVVTLNSYFEDDANVYILMELCRKRSLMEMLKRRKTLTTPEVRYFMRQIVQACKYLHDNQVIHRDLKLGNIFINDDMEIKVGDFGLATRISFEGERKKTLCGTPNYIAPEILNKKGHSFEVDMWSLGCIMYTLLVGSPPFETNNLKNTYNKIKKNDYYLPPHLESDAKELIRDLLHPDPESRPNADEILLHDFLTSGYIPSRLPTSCLSMLPRTTHNLSICDMTRAASQRPLAGIENIPKENAEQLFDGVMKDGENYKPLVTIPKDFYLSDLYNMIDSTVRCNPEALFKGQPEDSQDPSAIPFLWISKWVDYSDKYGLGYQLCDNSIGVSFNDTTHLILLSDRKSLQYIEMNNEEHFYEMGNFPPEMNKKITILNYFDTYMNENLLKAGACAKPREGDEMAHVPYVRSWFRTKSAILFHLTNGTFQANFFQDHTKIIICPLMGAVSYIDEEKNFSVYTFKLIEKNGCPPLLASRLHYARGIVYKLLKEFKKPA